ncbi:hypothetical protein EPN18_05230 [bacterium]|nr:MAG: hypothetical protein EPN18_05230 [bacterium]
MKRLRQETILEEMIKAGSAKEDVVKKIAVKIAGFHLRAEQNSRVASFASPIALRKNAEDNFAQTEAHIGLTISKKRHDFIRQKTLEFLKANEPLFLKRMKDGFIKDCHGDIHCENVSVEDNTVRIFDCIEFSERFRLSDTVADIAFLAMDIDFHNQRGLSELFTEEYFNSSNDPCAKPLLDFYKCNRAFIRGKVDGLKFLEPEVSEDEKSDAFLSAVRHFHLAFQYAANSQKPILIIVCGLSATGKTSLARRISEVFYAPRLSSDSVRKTLAGIAPNKQSPAQFRQGIYSDDFTEKTYAALIKSGAELLKNGRTCVLDATFSKERYRRLAKETAASCGADFHVIELIADDETIKERLKKRRAEPHSHGAAVSDMTRWDVLIEQKRNFEPLKEARVILDAKKPLEVNIKTAVQGMLDENLL